jgi:hypothetical protein
MRTDVLVGHHLLQDRHDRLALGEPLPADAAEHPNRVGLVEADGAGCPAIGKGEPVEIVEQARPSLRRKAHDGQRAQMRLAKPRLEASGQVLVDEEGVEVHRRLGDPHPLAAARDAGMEVGEGLGVVEPFGLGHESLDQPQHPVGAVDEPGERAAPVGAVAGSVLIEPGFRARRVLSRRQPEQGQEIPAFEVSAFLPKLRPALGVDQSQDRIGETAFGVAIVGLTLGFDEDRPAGAQAPQGVVQAAGDGDEFGRSRRVEIGAAKARRALE